MDLDLEVSVVRRKDIDRSEELTWKLDREGALASGFRIQRSDAPAELELEVITGYSKGQKRPP